MMKIVKILCCMLLPVQLRGDGHNIATDILIVSKVVVVATIYILQ